jgi:hypothetical protein
VRTAAALTLLALAACSAATPPAVALREDDRAWRALVDAGPVSVMPLLRAFSGAPPRSAHAFRSAVQAIVEKHPVDAIALSAFVRDLTYDGPSRRLAFETLRGAHPSAAEKVLPSLLDDPHGPLRREAVAAALKTVPNDPAALRALLAQARDRDQVDDLVKRLKGLGIETHLPTLYGFVTRWTLLASYDNSDAKGFGIAYAPEKSVDLKNLGAGRAGAPVRAVDHAVKDPLGKVDLNAVLGKEKAVVAYAFAAVESPEDRDAEIRLGSNNAVKIFVNGALLAFRDEYHHGMRMDQYVGRCRLRKGRNELLLKICQNDQKEDWAQTWSFQARICDSLGGAVPFRILEEAR